MPTTKPFATISKNDVAIAGGKAASLGEMTQAGIPVPLGFVVLAGAFAGGALVTGAHLLPPTLLVGPWLVRLAWLNLVLGAFNLLPALPMDGGRVLRAALSMHEDRSTATATAAKVARVLAILMIATGLAIDIWLVFIGVFVLMAAGAEERAVESDDHPRG